MHLLTLGQPSSSVCFKTNAARSMTLLKGEAALAARRHVASKLNQSTISALRRPLNVDKPDFALMQHLHDAGIGKCPVSGMPVFDPSACAPALRTAIWRVYCGVASSVNTKQIGQTDEAIEELQMRLHEHAAQLREVAPRSRQLSQAGGTLAKRSRESPTPSLSNEGTDMPSLSDEETDARQPSEHSRKKRVIDAGDDDE